MATQEQKNVLDLGEQAIALAEHLGRIAGTFEGKAESWLNQKQLADQLTRVRDGAAQMLEGLAMGVAKGRKLAQAGRGKAKQPKRAPAASARQAADPAHAPGKRRRKPAPSTPGLKKSDETIPKARLAEANRQRRKSYA